MKIAFAGTPAFAARVLSSLLAPPFEIVRVYAQPARPKGRGLEVVPSPVETLARGRSLPVSTPSSWDPDTARDLASSGARVLVTAAYGLILPRDVLDACPLGAVNVHASLLPRWRGAAPVQRALEAGDTETGITIFRLDEGVDTGPVLAMERIVIGADETASELLERLGELAASLLPRVLADAGAGRIEPRPQDSSLATRARKLAKEDGLLDWSLPAARIHAAFRAFQPWPGVSIGGVKILSCRVVEGRGRPGEILSVSPLVVATAEGALRLDRVQAPGRAPVAGEAYANGRRLAPGGDFR